MKKMIIVHDLGRFRRENPSLKHQDAILPPQGKDFGRDLFGHKVKKFEAHVTVNSNATGEKKFEPVKDKDGSVVDYKNVRLAGYLSVFRGPDGGDRDGEYIKTGAYKETLERFKTNPVMLKDHRNQTDSIAGSFDVVREDDKGLWVEGNLSHSPENRHARFLVAEGHLKTLSIGGIFHYEEDGRGIFKVDLFEGSLVAVPADPDAIVSTRDFTEEDVKRYKNFLPVKTDRD